MVGKKHASRGFYFQQRARGKKKRGNWLSTIGKTVNRNMTQRRIDWEASFDSDACRSSTSLAIRRCRKSSQTNTIPNTNSIGKTVVATRRLWKLLSTKQFSGNTEMSMENSEKCPQKEVKRSGKSARKMSVRRVERRLARSVPTDHLIFTEFVGPFPHREHSRILGTAKEFDSVVATRQPTCR